MTERVAQVGAYVEIDGESISVAQVGAYVEILYTRIHVAQVGAYVEILEVAEEDVYGPKIQVI